MDSMDGVRAEAGDEPWVRVTVVIPPYLRRRLAEDAFNHSCTLGEALTLGWGMWADRPALNPAVRHRADAT